MLYQTSVGLFYANTDMKLLYHNAEMYQYVILLQHVFSFLSLALCKYSISRAFLGTYHLKKGYESMCSTFLPQLGFLVFVLNLMHS